MHAERCPVCEGTGIVPGGFYNTTNPYDGWTSSISSETCRSCGGIGYVIVPSDFDCRRKPVVRWNPDTCRLEEVIESCTLGN